VGIEPGLLAQPGSPLPDKQPPLQADSLAHGRRLRRDRFRRRMPGRTPRRSDEPFRRAGAHLRKDSRSSTVVEFDLPVQGEPRRVIYKRFRVTDWVEPWKSLLRRSRRCGRGSSVKDCVSAVCPLPASRRVHRRRNGLQMKAICLPRRLPTPSSAAIRCRPGRPRTCRRRASLREALDQVARLVASCTAASCPT